MATRSNSTKTPERLSQDDIRVEQSIATMLSATAEAAETAERQFSQDSDDTPRIQTPAVSTLSFIKKRKKGGGYDYWADIEGRGSYRDDADFGKKCGEEFITFLGKYPTLGNSTLLNMIVSDMVANHATKGHLVGFLNTVNKYTVVGSYLAALEPAVPEHPWTKARRLGKELSQALADTGDAEFGYILPAGYEYAVGFGMLQEDSPRLGEFPMQTISRLGRRIAQTLRDDPEMSVERVTIDCRGVYSQLRLPDADDLPPVDPLLAALNEYREATKAFCAIPEDDDFRQNEERYVAETYGAVEQKLLRNVIPTTSIEGVKAAIRFAIDDGDQIDPVAKNALRSALHYLDEATA
ncbi:MULTISPECIES: hypothetical protein [unclassified Shinella]|uniref:hypothetical protein n=1 Tax=unclassified Shinella TaxID=2643062 RepID=UPI00225D51E8|nr:MULTISPECIES: hypothetical protein [unclassified Shinella]MCO5137420.1 hypothetical protein [Shinella sp.]MDC7257403.1 hypothetical protein [Shinella sp. YE25]CAI0340298.1 hypothetical protein SHINE37_44166 [Rhizobiaceae bacterium]CAK7258668.1 protein of unknown function [Shinella sp. WSC3-e]